VTKRSLTIVVCVVVLAGCAQKRFEGVERGSRYYRLIDLAGEFDALAADKAGVTPEEQLEAFRARVASRFPGFYDPDRTDWLTREEYQQQVLEAIENQHRIRERYRDLVQRFPAMLEDAVASFGAFFPDMPPIGDVYLVHSIYEMDGGTREIDGRQLLIFGADVMVMVQDFEDKRPFLHHELFHVYHARFFHGCEQLWCSIWSEGLAVLVASQLNPGATQDQLLLTSPAPMVDAIDENPGRAFCELSRLAASTDPDDYASVLGGGEALEGLPLRFGYYAGYLIARAKQSALDLSLAELAHMPNDRVRELILPELGRRCTVATVEQGQGAS
jgi:hypothetical protein